MDNLSILIKRAKEGDKEAFSKIYKLFYERIYRYAKYNFTEGPADICQETFLRAYKSIGKFSEKKGGSFQAYLFRIARNLIIDQKRKKQEVSLQEYWEIEEDSNLDEEIDKKQESIKLHSALLKLAPKERQIVILRYFEEMTTSEVAKVVGMREGALRVRAHRVLQKLKTIIEET